MSILQKFFGNKGSGNEKSKGKTCSACGAINPMDVKFCSSCGSEFHVVSDAFDAFISYRRETGSDLASLLKLHLESRFHKKIFLDVNELQVGRFDEELLQRIEKTPNFIVILSRASLDRCANKTDWLKREIVHALKTGRNIIPVMTEGFTFPSDELWALLPFEMRVLPSLNGVNYSHIHQDSAIRKIASYMKTKAEISGIRFSPPAKEIAIPSDRIISETPIPKTVSQGSMREEQERKDKETATTGKKDISASDIAISVRQEDSGKKNQQKEVSIGMPKIITMSAEKNKHISSKLGSIKVISLSNNSGSEHLIKLGKLTINKL